MDELFEKRTDLSSLTNAVEKIRTVISSVIVGQEQMVELMIVGLLSQGHILIEGVPGVAKTLAARLLSKSLDIPFSRLQFTPDLMPGDVIGTSIFNPRDLIFQFKKGPIFGSVVLVDEINRAPAKTQSALFEVMEERQVTVDGMTYRMSEPFIVLATQNPVEQEGTYRLPEAQLDRFLFKIDVGYPSLEEEVQILMQQQHALPSEVVNNIVPVLSASEIMHFAEVVRQMVVEPKLLEFIARLVGATRNHQALYLGASPRASLAILKSSKAMAAVRGRDFVIPEDIVAVTPHVLRHRLLLTPEKEMEGLQVNDLVQQIIGKSEVPR